MQNEEKKYALKKPLRMPATGAAAQILNNNIGNNIFYKFNKFEDFLAFCTYIKNMNWSVFESFSLFLLNSTYYLHSFNNISNNLDSILCEFSTKKDFSSRIFRYFK